MRIGIDIDGVLNNQYDFCVQYGTKFCDEINQYKLENLDVIDTTDMFLWSEDVAHKFWDKYRIELVSTIPARVFSSEVIKELKEKNNEIYIITARKNNDEWFPKELQPNVEDITKAWLNNNKIYYDNIYFNVKDKGKLCKDYRVDIMIEDDPKNIEKLIGNTNVYIYDAPYNRKKEYYNLTRVYSWYDILRNIKNCSGHIGDVS